MQPRSFEDMMADVADEPGDPADWRAAMRDREGVGTDLYLAHPSAGVYAASLYMKDPFTVRGVGAKVADRPDGTDYLPGAEADRRFAIRRGPRDRDEAERMGRAVAATLEAHATAPTSPDDLFDDIMDSTGGIAYGAMGGADSADGFDATYADAREMLDAELDDLIATDGIDRGVH